MNTHQDVDSSNAYACPMHPEVTGKKGDKCLKCGMELQQVQKNDADHFDVKIGYREKTIEAGKPANISVAITRNRENVQLDVVHEMKMHLLVVNEELTWFDHIHPKLQADGSYAVTETFPAGGQYLLFTNYKPSGSLQGLNKHELEVKGAPFHKKEEPYTKFISTVDDFTLSLENGKDFKTSTVQPLKFSLEKDGKRLQAKDIQNYLGASAHIVVISKADKDFLHIHPVSNSEFPIYAETQIKKPGTYRLWVQFQINGKVHTADFTVNVSQGENTTTRGYNHH